MALPIFVSALSSQVMKQQFQSPFLVALLGLSIILATTVSLWWYRWVQRNSQDPKTWPIIGSQKEVSRNFERLHDWMLQYFSNEHRTIKMKIFSRYSFSTVDPANVEYILKTNFKNFPKGAEANYRLHDMLGDGILNSDGEVWRKHRKVASAHFSTRKLRDYSVHIFRENALKLMKILDDVSRSNQRVDIHDLFNRMTLDSICKVGFGVDLGCLSPSLPDTPFARAFDTVNEITSRRFLNPFWKLFKVLNIGLEKILKQKLELINSFTSKVIRARRDEIETAKAVGKDKSNDDLLSSFMLFHMDEARAYNDNELRDSILNFLIAGRDTTAVTLSWFMHYVCQNPDVVEKVFHEMLDVLGLDGRNTKDLRYTEVANLLTYDSVNKMHYLHAALSETLRLHPAVPRDGKVAHKDDVLPDGTRVKAGQQVAYIPYSMGRMEFLWGEDALVFKPERWLKNGIFEPESPYKFTAFQGGPRICLGKESAYLQMKMTAALLLCFFNFQLAPGHVVRYRLLMVLSMANGLPLTITRRDERRP